MSAPAIVWSVSGSDSGGGAGLQADLRAFDAFGVHGCTAVAAITAQNSLAVRRADAVAPELLDAQLAALADDLPPRAVKCGMLGSAENARVLATWVRRLGVPLVVDPVWRATTGGALADDALHAALRDELLPLATVVTPNRAEAAWLLGRDLPADAAARALCGLGAQAAVVTGGDDGGEDARDAACTLQAAGWLVAPHIATPHHHGSGCTFASAAAAALALGFCEADAVVLAKMVTTDALARATPAGQGAGPVRPRAGFARHVDVPAWHDETPAAHARPFPSMDGPIGLYPIVDDASWLPTLAAAGVRTVQLRIKHGTPGELHRQVAEAAAAARRHGLRLFVNDHWALAIEHRAYGVHLGQQDLDDAELPAIVAAGLRLGISTHAPWEVARAVARRPSYVACGPVHPTTTKDMPWAPQRTHNLAFWCTTLGHPVVAIGGLDVPRAAEAAACGADGVAVLRGIVQAPDPMHAARAYLDALRAAAGAPRMTAPVLPRPTLPHGGRPTRRDGLPPKPA